MEKIIETEEKVTLTDYISRIVELKNAISANLIILGGLFLEIKRGQLYLEQNETFEEFIANPEISFSRATVYKAMRVYEVFVEKSSLLDKVKDIDADKLYLVSGLIEESKDETEKMEWVATARELSRSDLRSEVKKAKGLPQHDYTMTLLERIEKYVAGYSTNSFPKRHKQECINLIEDWEAQR